MLEFLLCLGCCALTFRIQRSQHFAIRDERDWKKESQAQQICGKMSELPNKYLMRLKAIGSSTRQPWSCFWVLYNQDLMNDWFATMTGYKLVKHCRLKQMHNRIFFSASHSSKILCLCYFERFLWSSCSFEVRIFYFLRLGDILKSSRNELSLFYCSQMVPRWYSDLLHHKAVESCRTHSEVTKS